jgi:hypothetical protein
MGHSITSFFRVFFRVTRETLGEDCMQDFPSGKEAIVKRTNQTSFNTVGPNVELPLTFSAASIIIERRAKNNDCTTFP